VPEHFLTRADELVARERDGSIANRAEVIKVNLADARSHGLSGAARGTGPSATLESLTEVRLVKA